MIPEKLRLFYEQIDLSELQDAIKFVNRFGSGTKVYYRRGVTHPYKKDIYISVELHGEKWTIAAHDYGTNYNSQMSQALSFAADSILENL